MVFGRFVGSFTGELVGRAIANQRVLKRHRQELELQQRFAVHRAHPLTRLGIAGIISTRVHWAVDDVLQAVQAVGGLDWAFSDGVELPDGASGGVAVTRLRNRVLVIVVSLDGYSPTDVARADWVAWTVSSLDDHRLSVAAILCVVGAEPEVEPRDLPGPSGNPVAVLGPSWLLGVLRQRMGAPQAVEGDPPECLVKAMSVAGDRAIMRGELVCDLLRSLNPACWWIVECLFLDDGHVPPVGCVVAGMYGTFVLEFEVGDRTLVVDLARFNASRIRSYLPFPDVVPIVVSMAAEPGVDIRLTGGGAHEPLIVNPSDILRLVLNSRMPALKPPQIAQLIAPLHGWSRQVGPGTTHINLRWVRPC
jgi:hypothetical protein